MNLKYRAASRIIFAILFTINFLFVPIETAKAATNLTVTPITWNVIGLDSNNVLVGPNNFPVGARVCNTGAEAADNVIVDFVWDNPGAYINLRPGSLTQITTDSIPPFPAPNCVDYYFEIEITRNAAAYDKTADFHIEVNSDDTDLVSTPSREIYVEHLISQSRNSTTNVTLDTSTVNPGGTMTLMVGQTYNIKLFGSTATNGYEQIESYINFPNTIFQINSIKSTYSANGGTDPDALSKVYADGCLWENDPNSPNYRSCLSTGKYGGVITVDYNVTIIGGAGTSEVLNTLIYDFSGSSYHYNADFSAESRIVNIVSPAEISKFFSPNTIAIGDTSTLTFTLTSNTTNTLQDLNFVDSTGWPSGLVIATPSGLTTPTCTGGTLTGQTITANAGESSVTMTDGDLSPGAICSFSVNVTSDTDGTYANVTDNLFIGTTNTGDNATATLVVSSLPPLDGFSCTTPTTLVAWNFDSGDGGTATNPTYTSSTKASDVSTATATAGLGTAGVASFNTTLGGSTSGVNSWSIVNGWNLNPPADPPDTPHPTHESLPYFEFQIDTSNYSDVAIQISYAMLPNNSWGSTKDNQFYVHTSNDGGTTWIDETVPSQAKKGSWQLYTDPEGLSHEATGAATGTSTTTFRINATGASNTAGYVLLDDVTIVGCQRPTPPTLSKSFSPVTVGSDSTVPPDPTNNYTTLTFAVGNTNAYALTGVAFNDPLPDGLVVANPPTVTEFSCTSGIMTGTVAAIAGSNTISLSAGSLPAGDTTTCSFSVRVQGTTPGTHTNITNRIEADYTGANLTGGANVGYGQADLTVLAAPVISKFFGANDILTGSNTNLTFYIYNPNTTTALTGIQFTDTLPGGLIVASPNGLTGSCGGGTITADGGSDEVSLSGATLAGGVSCLFSVDVHGNNAGLKQNSVTVSSTNGGTGNTAEADLLVKDPVPLISLLKQVGLTASGGWTSFLRIGTNADIYYRFVVENTGDEVLNQVNVTDPDLSLESCSWVDGDGVLLSAPFTLQVADSPLFDYHKAICILGPITTNSTAGSYPNTATASGTGTLTVTDRSTATYNNPGLTIEKSAEEIYFTAVGDVLTYDYLVTNSGYSSLEGPVVVDDDLATDEDCNDVDTAVQTSPPGPGDGDNWLDVGEQIACTATYTVTPGNVSDEYVTNVASAAADGVISPTDSVTVPLLVAPTVTKTFSPDIITPGGISTLSITIENTNPIELTDVAFTDSFPVGVEVASTPNASATNCGTPTYSPSATNTSINFSGGTIAASATCTVVVDVTSSTPGTHTNMTSVVTSTEAPDSATVSDDLTVLAAPLLEVVKTNDTVGDEAAVGDLITYTFEVSHAAGSDGSEVDGSALTVIDDVAGAATYQSGDAGDDDVLESGETWTYEVSYTVLVSDPDPLVNIVTVSDGVDLDGDAVPEATDTNSVDITYKPSLKLTKVGTLNDDDGTAGLSAGDTISYSFTVENTGDVILTNILLTDTVGGVTLSGGPIATLAVGASESSTYTGSYAVTQTDIDAGFKNNTATATSDEGATDDDDEMVTLSGTPAIGITKNSTTTSVTSAGQIVPYDYVITNTGNVTLTNVTLADNNTDAVPVCVPAQPAILAPGAIINCTAQYTVTNPEFNAGGNISNIATVDSDQTGTVQETLDIPIVRIFDPPFGFKNYDDTGLPVLEWTMVWINDSNTAAMDAEVYDPIPPGTTYITGSITCDARGDSETDPGGCYFDAGNNQIVWTGTIDPDPGATNAAEADHEIVITFQVDVPGAMNTVENEAVLDADLDDDGTIERSVAQAQSVWIRRSTLPPIPETGFAPGIVTEIPQQRLEQKYSQMGGIWLEIPSLGIRSGIVGVPIADDLWDVTWLANQTGWLEGTAFPSYSGNSVLTAHVYLPSGLPGPFVNLQNLNWDDQIIVHAYGKQYIFLVRSNQIIEPENSSATRHEEYPWLTLLTCKEFNELTGSYNYRVMVRAVLIEVKSDLFH